MASDTDALALAELLERLTAEGLSVRGTGDLATPVTGATLDSRRVAPGDLYAALPGAHGHGATYWQQARDAGAAAVLTDADGAGLVGDGVPALVVPEVRPVLGRVAAEIGRASCRERV